ncbi:MAG: hypothetical protein U5K36_01580 [Roseovarius sp.]|nr:hypothetical protein [Roseovarius sp.]
MVAIRLAQQMADTGEGEVVTRTTAIPSAAAMSSSRIRVVTAISPSELNPLYHFGRAKLSSECVIASPSAINSLPPLSTTTPCAPCMAGRVDHADTGRHLVAIARQHPSRYSSTLIELTAPSTNC